MKISMSAMIVAVALAGTGALAQQHEQAEAFHVREAMQTVINPAIMAIWDIGNNAMNEEGGIDPALMDPAKWSALAEAAGALEATGHDMAGAQTLRAAGEDNQAVEDFEVTMDQVQAALDADPEGFRRLAATFATHAGELKAAAEAQDAVAAGELVAGMDAACAECHAQFWYAE